MANTSREFTVRARAFSSEGVREHRVQVDSRGVIRVWDSVAGHYTSCHSLSQRVQRRIRKLAQSVAQAEVTHECVDGESYTFGEWLRAAGRESSPEDLRSAWVAGEDPAEYNVVPGANYRYQAGCHAVGCGGYQDSSIHQSETVHTTRRAAEEEAMAIARQHGGIAHIDWWSLGVPSDCGREHP